MAGYQTPWNQTGSYGYQTPWNQTAMYRMAMNTGPQFNPGRPNETAWERWQRERQDALDARNAERDANRELQRQPDRTYEHQSPFEKWKEERDWERGPTREVPTYAGNDNNRLVWGGGPRQIGHRDVRERDVSRGDPATGGYGGASFNQWSANRDDYRRAVAAGDFENMSPSQREEARMDMGAFREEQARQKEEQARQKEEQARQKAEAEADAARFKRDVESEDPGPGDDWDREREEDIESLRDQRRKRWTQEDLARADRWSEEDRLAAQRDPNHPWPTVYDTEKFNEGMKKLYRGDPVGERRARELGLNEAIDDMDEYDKRQQQYASGAGVAADIGADAQDMPVDPYAPGELEGRSAARERRQEMEDAPRMPGAALNPSGEELYSMNYDTGLLKGQPPIDNLVNDPRIPGAAMGPSSGELERSMDAEILAARREKVSNQQADFDAANREKIGTATDKIKAAGKAGHLPAHVVEGMLLQLWSGRPSAYKDVMWRLNEMGVRGGWIAPTLPEGSLQRRTRRMDGLVGFGEDPFDPVFGNPGVMGEGPVTAAPPR